MAYEKSVIENANKKAKVKITVIRQFTNKESRVW